MKLELVMTLKINKFIHLEWEYQKFRKMKISDHEDWKRILGLYWGI